MVDQTEVWQLKVKIENRIADGSMTVEQLKAFVALSKEDLDKVFPSSSKPEPELVSNEVKGVQRLVNSWGNK